jgi:O-antigen ligase
MSADVINSKSLYLQTSGYKNHNHLGDLWAVVILVVSYYLIKTKNRLYWLIVIPGIYFLAISLSRAAYLALFLGAIYLFTKLDWLKKYNKAALLIILITTGFFIFAGAHKITLLSRPYFIQGIAGTIHNPLGVGVGNFKVISLDRANHYWEMSWFSSTAHNIILEMLVGMGVLGSVFIAWLVFVSKDIWANNGRKRILYQSLFVALGVNFLFGTTYFIPTMLWLWFGCLGLTQKKAVK